MVISIHALRKESDREGPSDALALAISIHALRKESDDLVGGGSGRDVRHTHSLVLPIHHSYCSAQRPA